MVTDPSGHTTVDKAVGVGPGAGQVVLCGKVTISELGANSVIIRPRKNYMSARFNPSQSKRFMPTPPPIITGEFAAAGMTDKGDRLWKRPAKFPNTVWAGLAPEDQDVSGYTRVILAVPNEIGNIAEIARSMNTGDWTPKWATNFGASRHHGKPGTLAEGIAWLEGKLDSEWVAKIVGQIIERGRKWDEDEAKGQGN